jgi:hypothetical protein
MLHAISPVEVPKPQRARERLSFVLPDFNRHSWVSEGARSVWEPRITRIVRAWEDIEWLSVAHGVRDCGLLWISPDALLTLIPKWTDASLSAIRLNVDDSPVSGASGLICIVVGSGDRIEQLRGAWAALDDEAVGTLLGYPSCCRSFFRAVWVDERNIDTTWPMAENTSHRHLNGIARIELPEEIMPLANILWRWVGVRAVPHLPCRFDCAASIAFGRRLLEVGRNSGYSEEADWIAEILAWPVEWSALHGIAEVKSPLMKIATRTDATPEKWTVHWVGTKYPAEGAVGLRFPFQAPKKPMLTSSPGFKRGLAHGSPAQGSQPATGAAWQYADNGFTSAVVMRELHQPIVDLARRELASVSGNVLDLGCGNGALLATICSGRSDLTMWGVDSNGTSLDHARQLLPQLAENFAQGDLFDFEMWNPSRRRYVLAVIMLGRLLEVPQEKAMQLLRDLQSSCECVLVYAYPDWQQQPLVEMAHSLGLELEDTGYKTAAILAGSGVNK